MCGQGVAGPVGLTAARVPVRCQAPCRTRRRAGTSWPPHPASRNDVTASVKPSGSSQKSRWPSSGKVTSRASGIRSASSLPLRGSTTVSAPPCRTSVRARMRACLQRPAYSAPAAAWAASGSRVRRRLGVLQLEKAIDEFWMALDGPRGQGILRVAAPCHLGPDDGGDQDQPHGGRGHGVGEGPARCRAGKDETVDPLGVGNRQLLGHHPAQAGPHHVGPADASGIEHGDDIAGHGGYGEQAAGRSLRPNPRLSTSTSRKWCRSFRSTGSHPERSKPIPWIRTSHGRRRCIVPRNS